MSTKSRKFSYGGKNRALADAMEASMRDHSESTGADDLCVAYLKTKMDPSSRVYNDGASMDFSHLDNQSSSRRSSQPEKPKKETRLSKVALKIAKVMMPVKP